MVKLLRPPTNSQRLVSFLRMNDIIVSTGNLEGHLNRMIVDAGALI